MRRSIATVSLSGTMPEKLEAIAAARFDGVEIFENDLLFFDGPPRDVRRHASDLGLSIDLFQPFRDFEAVGDAQFARNLDRAERKFDLMEQLGAPLMLVCSNVQADAIDDDERSAAQLHELAERAGRRGLKLGFEALSWGTHVRTFDRAWRIVERANHPHLGIILDSFHTLALPDDWSSLPRLPGHKIAFVQMADAPRLGMHTLTLSRHFRNFPGQGDLDTAAFLKAILDTGYAGTISLEIFNDDFRAAPARQTAADAMRSLLWLEESVRRKGEGDAGGAAAARPSAKRRRVDLFDPPVAPALAGVTFVEFTVDTHTEPALAEMFRRLGFGLMGRHRTKDVALYGQGEVRIILNKELDSFAHSYMLVHGPSVCAIAIETDDAVATLARAEAYGCVRFEGRINTDEKEIPAVRALNGSLIYFVDRIEGSRSFENDFDLVASPPADAVGLVRIDHIAEALPEGQMDAWVLFYRAVLGLEPEDIFVLPDPYGLVRSKTLSNRERTVRLPLNISESRNTATARSVTTFAGAGVNHIALESRDIFASARAARALGSQFLRMPANYYEDIAARFPLPEGLVEQMRDYDILYDRQGDGEFFQFYTRSFEDRFFFEVVERRGGYDLYGAANAPVRMAALAQARTQPAR